MTKRHRVIILLLAVAIISALAQPSSTPIPNKEWGLVNVACASLRGAPQHSAELETQATMGTPVLLDILQSGEWRMSTLPDGYTAWIHTSAFIPITETEMTEWREKPRVVVTHSYGGVVEADTTTHEAVSDVTLGAVLQGTLNSSMGHTHVTLPDGRTGYLPSSILADFATWSGIPTDMSTIVKCAKTLTGVTYLWGGTTPKALDCSGFTQTCFRAGGILLPRNASAQARVGDSISVATPELWHTGDLLFFGPDPDTTRITHVGLYLGEGRYIHCSGMVATNSINPADPLYLPRRVLAVRRIRPDYARIEHHTSYF